jgi:hypothetical protein
MLSSVASLRRADSRTSVSLSRVLCVITAQKTAQKSCLRPELNQTIEKKRRNKKILLKFENSVASYSKIH